MLEVRPKRDFWNLSDMSTLVLAATLTVLIGIVHEDAVEELMFSVN